MLTNIVAVNYPIENKSHVVFQCNYPSINRIEFLWYSSYGELLKSFPSDEYIVAVWKVKSIKQQVVNN